MTKVEMLEIIHTMREVMVCHGHLSGAFGLKDGAWTGEACTADSVSLMASLARAMRIEQVGVALNRSPEITHLFDRNNPWGVWTSNGTLPAGATWEMIFDTLRRVEKAINETR